MTSSQELTVEVNVEEAGYPLTGKEGRKPQKADSKDSDDHTPTPHNCRRRVRQVEPARNVTVNPISVLEGTQISVEVEHQSGALVGAALPVRLVDAALHV